MTGNVELSVVLDQTLGIAVQKTLPEGSTIRDLKVSLAGDDPSGQADPKDIVLLSAFEEDGSPLPDATVIDESLLVLVVGTEVEAKVPEVQEPVPPPPIDASAGGDSGRLTAMQHLLARTKPADLPTLSMAREVYNIINCADENGLDYDDFEEYMEALEQYWTTAIMDEDGAEPVLDDAPAGALFDEEKYNEGRLFKARGDLLEKQQKELLCRQYLKMLTEVMDYPWVPGEGVQKPDDGFEPIEIGEDGVPIRKVMKTGYVDNLMGGMASDLDKYVDVRKVWCLSEQAAHIGQARKELIESVLTAHSMDVKAGGKGILIEQHWLGRRAAEGAISLEDIRKELDSAYEAKFNECTEMLPGLMEEVTRAQQVCDDRQRDIDRVRREREEQFAAKRAAADAEAQAAYDKELAEWREECRQADLREEEERKRKEVEAEAQRKAVHDAARRRCLLARYGQ